MIPEIGRCTHARHPHAAAVFALVIAAAGCNPFGPKESFEGEWTAPAGKS